MKLFDAFRGHREQRPDEPAFMIASGDRALPISWRQFTDDIAVIAWLIDKHEVKTVALIGENSYEWMATHAACLFTGTTVVPLDVNLDAEEISRRLKFVGADVLVHSSLYADKAHEVAAMTPGLKTGGFGTRKTDLVLNAGHLAIKAGFKTIWQRPCRVRDGETAMIVFTSGTTSEPRGAELTVAGIEAFADSTAISLPMRPGERSLMVLPLHHIFGVCVAYLLLSRGVVPGVCPDFRRLYDAVERFAADYLFLVPALVDVLAGKIERRGRSAEEALGYPLRWILSGGAAMPRRVYERMTALGVKVLCGYGLTETTALYSMDPSDGEIAVGSAGRRSQLPECETTVSASGELLTRGPGVMKGYFRNPEKTAAAIDADGWLHTGDLGRIDADGNVWITGRASRTIVLSSGKKIAPEELEEKLHAIPGVLEAVVSGDGESREIRAEVYASVSEETVRRAVGELNLRLPVYKRIGTVTTRSDPFPRTASGKIKYS